MLPKRRKLLCKVVKNVKNRLLWVNRNTSIMEKSGGVKEIVAVVLNAVRAWCKGIYPDVGSTAMALGFSRSVSTITFLYFPSRSEASIRLRAESVKKRARLIQSTARPSGDFRSAAINILVQW